jgi:glutathione S-transferase
MKNGSDVASIKKYTVPVIHHIPSSTILLDSIPIAQFLEQTYPFPPLILTSALGTKIEQKGRSSIGKILQTTIIPREIHILNPPSQVYFRRTREAAYGCTLEDMLDLTKEEEMWIHLAPDSEEVGRLMLTNRDKGQFILGEDPSFTDFFLAGFMESLKMVDEELFERINGYEGFASVYKACLPFMNKRD